MAKQEKSPQQRQKAAQKRHKAFRQTVLQENPYFSESTDYQRFLKKKRLSDNVDTRERFYESRSKVVRNELRLSAEQFIRNSPKSDSLYQESKPTDMEEKTTKKLTEKEKKEIEQKQRATAKKEEQQVKQNEKKKRQNRKKAKEFISDIKKKIVAAPKRSKKTLANIAARIAEQPNLPVAEALFKPIYPKENWFPAWSEKHQIEEKIPKGVDLSKPFPKGELTEGEYRVIRTYHNNPNVSLRDAARGKITGEKSKE